MPILIRQEEPKDVADVWNVHRLAFQRKDEGNLVDSLRSGGFVRVSLVAELHGQIVGHILFSELPIIAESQTILALSLAPLAVAPEYQQQGIGSKLVEIGLAECQKAAHRIVIVLGHPEFYSRFGFSSELAKPLVSPFSGDAWMAIELEEGALKNVAGRVAYPAPFGLP